MKLFNRNKKVLKHGYIHLTDKEGYDVLVNIEAIQRYEPYEETRWNPNTKSRLIYLDGSKVRVREDVNEIANLISRHL